MEENRAYLPRGSKSRNKVSVGEPAEGLKTGARAMPGVELLSKISSLIA